MEKKGQRLKMTSDDKFYVETDNGLVRSNGDMSVQIEGDFKVDADVVKKIMVMQTNGFVNTTRTFKEWFGNTPKDVVITSNSDIIEALKSLNKLKSDIRSDADKRVKEAEDFADACKSNLSNQMNKTKRVTIVMRIMTAIMLLLTLWYIVLIFNLVK